MYNVISVWLVHLFDNDKLQTQAMTISIQYHVYMLQLIQDTALKNSTFVVCVQEHKTVNNLMSMLFWQTVHVHFSALQKQYDYYYMHASIHCTCWTTLGRFILFSNRPFVILVVYSPFLTGLSGSLSCSRTGNGTWR